MFGDPASGDRAVLRREDRGELHRFPFSRREAGVGTIEIRSHNPRASTRIAATCPDVTICEVHAAAPALGGCRTSWLRHEIPDVTAQGVDAVLRARERG